MVGVAIFSRFSAAVAIRPTSLIGSCSARLLSNPIASGVPIWAKSAMARLTAIADSTFGSFAIKSLFMRRSRWISSSGVPAATRSRSITVVTGRSFSANIVTARSGVFDRAHIA